MSAARPAQRFFRRRRVPLELQTEAAECGLACLAMIAGYFGRRTGLAELRRRLSISLKGATLPQLMAFARTLGFDVRAVRLEPAELPRLAVPCVLHWTLDHFVVLEKVTRRHCVVVDPANGRRTLSAGEMDRAFTGVALEVTPTAAFRRRKRRTRLHLRDLVAGSQGLGHALAMTLALSVALQVLALVLPFYSQIVIDEVVVSGDRDLLRLLVIAFALLVAMQALIGMFRSWVVVTLGTQLNVHWTTRVFRHLLRLPLHWFERRHLGDVQSRFGSVTALQELLSRQFVEVVIDGAMAVSTLAVMLYYDVTLTLVVVLSVAVYLAVRLALFPAMRRATRLAVVAGAKKDSTLLESVRGVLAIKNFGKEAERETGFRNRLVDACNASLRASRLSVWRQGASQLVFGLQLIVVIWLAAAAVLAGRLTIGMLVAFLAYRAMFSERCAALVDRVLEFRLARVQLDRLADIVHARPETDAVDPASRCERRATPLSLSAASVSFRYADNEPGVLRDVTLAVRPGEHVVLTGASGAGKTTLLKVLMGLLPPCGGQVLVDGVPLYRYGLQRYRREIASVMQEDRLFDGTIMDNICFFDPAPDERRAVACAQLADIAALVEAMPMRYYSLIGDMGTQLSGGQKQRLLLARALYARPRILFLDEYTSHLDALTEQRVSERLAHLSVTVVSVSHRREAIRRAGRVIEVGCAG